MRVSRIVTRVRDRLNEATANIFTDAELVRYIDEAAQDLFRQQSQVDESYHNHVTTILGASSRDVSTDTRLYDLRQWVHKIIAVRPSGTGSQSRENTIPAMTLHNQSGSFWAFHGMSRIMVQGADAGSDLQLYVSKGPAGLNVGTVSTVADVSASQTQLYLDHATMTYDIEFEVDAYANSMFEMTDVNSSGHIVEGQVRQCVASENVTSSTGLPFTKCTMDRPWDTIPVAADKWEMRPEVHTAHISYLVLLASQKAYVKKSNWEALRTIQPDIQRESMRFIESITPRQEQTLNYAGMDRSTRFQHDTDRDRSW